MMSCQSEGESVLSSERKDGLQGFTFMAGREIFFLLGGAILFPGALFYNGVKVSVVFARSGGLCGGNHE